MEIRGSGVLEKPRCWLNNIKLQVEGTSNAHSQKAFSSSSKEFKKMVRPEMAYSQW